MISVISMLADPNGDSPANVDAAVSEHIDQKQQKESVLLKTHIMVVTK